MSYAFLDHPGPVPYAHRGGALEGLENTMPAFAGAWVRSGEEDVAHNLTGPQLARSGPSCEVRHSETGRQVTINDAG